MKRMIADSQKINDLGEVIDVVDGSLEVGNNLEVDGNIIVNSADNLVDTDGNPIISGGGGRDLYCHNIFWNLSSSIGQYVDITEQANFQIISAKEEAYTPQEIYEFLNSKGFVQIVTDYKLFKASGNTSSGIIIGVFAHSPYVSFRILKNDYTYTTSSEQPPTSPSQYKFRDIVYKL